MCTTMDRYEAGSCHVHKPSADLSSSSPLDVDRMLPGCQTRCPAVQSFVRYLLCDLCLPGMSEGGL